MTNKKLYVITAKEFDKIEWRGNRKGLGLVKVGETTRDKVEKRINEQAAQLPMTLELYKEFNAITKSGIKFNDKLVHKYLEYGLKFTRIKSIEWFEATKEEICSAITDIIEEKVSIDSINKMGKKCKLLPTKKPWKSSQKHEINKEKEKINALEIVKCIRKGYITNREIAAELHKSLNLKYIAPKTMEPLVGEVIKKLKKLNIIENKEEFHAPKLEVLEYTYSNEQLETIYPKGSTGEIVYKEEILEYLENSKYGGTLEGMANYFKTSKPALTRGIKELYENKDIIKVNITKHDGFNGIRTRYFILGMNIVLPRGEYFKITKKESEINMARDILSRIEQGERIAKKDILSKFKMKSISTFISRYSSDKEVKEVKIDGICYLVSRSVYNDLKSAPYINLEDNIMKIIKISKCAMNIQRLINLLEAHYGVKDYNVFYDFIKDLVSRKKLFLGDRGQIRTTKEQGGSWDSSLIVNNTSLSEEYIGILLNRVQSKPCRVMDISKEVGISRDRLLKALMNDSRFIVYKETGPYLVIKK